MPVLGIADELIAARANFFKRVAEDQLSKSPFSGLPISVSDAAWNAVATGYFALSQAYKQVRLDPEHRTNPAKIGALTAIAISSFSPLRPPPAEEPLEHEQLIYMNPILAMRCACIMIDHPYHTRSFDERRRTYQGLLGLDFPSLVPFINDVNEARLDPAEEISLQLTKDETAKVDMLVCMFGVLQQQKIFKASHSDDCDAGLAG